MVVREGSNVSLRCAASGSPPPAITWRREGGELITLSTGQEGNLMMIHRIHKKCSLNYISNIVSNHLVFTLQRVSIKVNFLGVECVLNLFNYYKRMANCTFLFPNKFRRLDSIFNFDR
ncbi:hypothetical protein AAG570_005937 [Ranatra chinensis]|uniref:Ig-like domain-containing protein n=1 Tax=Ranatra chinensis TaxID=642074 RepID=A0ABD0XXP0_9HEMI